MKILYSTANFKNWKIPDGEICVNIRFVQCIKLAINRTFK